MGLRRAGLLLACLLIACGCGPTSRTPPATPVAFGPPLIRGVAYHGMWTNRGPAERALILDQIAASGVGWVRMDVAWKDLQPDGPDSFDPQGVAELDVRLKEIRDRGLKTLVMFWWAPAWSSGHSDQSGVPVNPQDYAMAARWLVSRWPSEIAALQVWNEPNLPEFFADQDPTAYARLLSAAYPRVKSVRPDLTVVTAAPSGLDLAWYRGFLGGTAATAPYDAIGVHPYPTVGDLSVEECDAPDSGCNIGLFLSMLEGRGLPETPIWVTEFGWSTHTGFRGMQAWQRGVTEEEQAQYTAAMLAAFSSVPQIEAAFIYRDQDFAGADPHWNGFGVLRTDSSTKPVYKVLTCSTFDACRALSETK